MSGNPILQEILARGEGFGHRQHLELTWRCLAEHGPEAAGVRVADAIRQVAAAHGAPAKFHATLTTAWVHCIAVHRQRWPAPEFDEFIDRNPELLDPKLLAHFYAPATLASEHARTRVIAPDLRPLPALAAE
jgi:hypothetical protein